MRVTDADGKEVIGHANAACITLELNSAPRLAIHASVEALGQGGRQSLSKVVQAAKFGNFSHNEISVPCRFETISRGYEIAGLNTPDHGDTLHARLIDPDVDAWLDERSSHGHYWYAAQRRDEETVAGFLSRLFGNRLDHLRHPDYLDALLPVRATLIRPGDITNRDLIHAVTGWLQRRWTSVTGTIVYPVDTGPVRLIATPSGPGAVSRLTSDAQVAWRWNPGRRAEAHGEFWSARDVRRYMRTDWGGNPPDLDSVMTGAYDPDCDDHRIILPGPIVLGDRLFTCVRTEIAFADSPNCDPLTVTAYLAPAGSFSSLLPSLPESRIRVKAKVSGWHDDGLGVNLKPSANETWAIGGDGLAMDTTNSLFAEFFSAAPPFGEFAGFYSKPQPASVLPVTLCNGGIPVIAGGPQRKCPELESADIVINQSVVAISTSPGERQLAQADRIHLSGENFVSRSKNLAVQTNTTTIGGARPELTVGNDVVVDCDLYATGKVEMG